MFMKTKLDFFSDKNNKNKIKYQNSTQKKTSVSIKKLHTQKSLE